MGDRREWFNHTPWHHAATGDQPILLVAAFSCADAKMRHPALPSRHTWETFSRHRCQCGSSTIELDYCVWAVSTSQLKGNEREGRAALRHRQRKGGTGRVGIFKQ